MIYVHVSPADDQPRGMLFDIGGTEFSVWISILDDLVCQWNVPLLETPKLTTLHGHIREFHTVEAAAQFMVDSGYRLAHPGPTIH